MKGKFAFLKVHESINSRYHDELCYVSDTSDDSATVLVYDYIKGKVVSICVSLSMLREIDDDMASYILSVAWSDVDWQAYIEPI